MVMIKVIIRNCHLASNFIDYNKFHAMKDWCRETFGKNKTRESYTWRTNKVWIYVNVFNNKLYPVFYFAKQEHANWFTLKWL